MKLPFRRLTRQQLEWLATHTCKAHRVSYLEHYNCFVRENPAESPWHESIGYFDIETTGLKADFHYVLSYAILDNDTKKIWGRTLTSKEILNGTFDKKLLKELITNLNRFDRIVVHYGSDYRFDIPFVRTLCVHYGYRFPLYRDIFVTDTQPILRAKFCLSSNRLGAACKFFGIPAKNHPIEEPIWKRASIGDPKALRFIWKHNVEDVISLRALYKKIKPYIMTSQKRSI